MVSFFSGSSRSGHQSGLHPPTWHLFVILQFSQFCSLHLKQFSGISIIPRRQTPSDRGKNKLQILPTLERLTACLFLYRWRKCRQTIRSNQSSFSIFLPTCNSFRASGKCLPPDRQHSDAPPPASSRHTALRCTRTNISARFLTPYMQH